MNKIEKLIRKFEREYEKGDSDKAISILKELKKLEIHIKCFAGYIEFIDKNINILYSIKMKKEKISK